MILFFFLFVFIVAQIPCPPGTHFSDHNLCVPCSKGRYNHGNMTWDRDHCYDIVNREISYFSSTEVRCQQYWFGTPVYEDGEYQSGCVDLTPTSFPSLLPTKNPLQDIQHELLIWVALVVSICLVFGCFYHQRTLPTTDISQTEIEMNSQEDQHGCAIVQGEIHDESILHGDIDDSIVQGYPIA